MILAFVWFTQLHKLWIVLVKGCIVLCIITISISQSINFGNKKRGSQLDWPFSFLPVKFFCSRLAHKIVANLINLRQGAAKGKRRREEEDYLWAAKELGWTQFAAHKFSEDEGRKGGRIVKRRNGRGTGGGGGNKLGRMRSGRTDGRTNGWMEGKKEWRRAVV
jgi:hypothetical protein